MTNKELGQAARGALKEAGFNLKDISVRTKYAGYEQVLWVQVKSENVDADAVANVLRQFRKVDYDEATQEVLAGGNTYVTVLDAENYSH